MEGSVPYFKFITLGISPNTEIYRLRVLSGDKLQITDKYFYSYGINPYNEIHGLRD